jgi:hypothetical protein
MIARIWRGTVRAAEADRYYEYLQKTGLKEYAETPGNRGVYACAGSRKGSASSCC